MDVIATLKAERDRIDAAIKLLEGGKSVSVKTQTKDSGRAPYGLLQKLIYEILESEKEPISISDLRDRVLENYPYSNKASLYSSIFRRVSNDKRVKKSKDGSVSLIRSDDKGSKKKKAKSQ